MNHYLLLFAAAAISAAISGAAGFGGPLLLLPILSATVGVTHAMPLMIITQLIATISRAGFGVRQIQWKMVALFLVSAVPLCILGTYFSIDVSQAVATQAIGGVILLFVALKFTGIIQINGGPPLVFIGGGIVGFLSGTITTAAPLGPAVFLTLGLPPVAYIASEATTALVLHGTRALIAQHYLTLDQQLWTYAALMCGGAIIGTWGAKLLIERLTQKTFLRCVTVFLVLVAVYMVISGQ